MIVDSILIDFINLLKTNDSINNLQIKRYYNFILIYTTKISNNLHHYNPIIDYVIHNIDFIILDTNYNVIKYTYKNILITNDNKERIINELSDNWTSCKIYYNHVGSYIYLFTYQDEIYYFMKYYIKKLNEDQYIKSIDTNIPKSHDEELILISQHHKHILSYNDDFILQNKIYLDVNSNEKFFSCFDELEFEMANSIKLQEKAKKLINAGFIIKYKGMNYIYPNKLYDKINNLILNTLTTDHTINVNRVYLDLYKSDNLNFAINYLSLYPSDIIKRINQSFKTLAKEYLNLYHLTREKAHPEIYNQLNATNKKILFNLHKLFINTRNEEFNFRKKDDDDDDYIDKKSVNVDSVYKFIKRLSLDILEEIYLNRNNLIKEIKENIADENINIFIEDCINTKTISYLLSR